MPASENASEVVYPRFVVDEGFLKNAVETLDRLHEESAMRGHSMLASLLSIAKGEAEDDLRTKAKLQHLTTRIAERDDDGAAELAQKLACGTAAANSDAAI
jgi:hypothetical protein